MDLCVCVCVCVCVADALYVLLYIVSTENVRLASG